MFFDTYTLCYFCFFSVFLSFIYVFILFNLSLEIPKINLSPLMNMFLLRYPVSLFKWAMFCFSLKTFGVPQKLSDSHFAILYLKLLCVHCLVFRFIFNSGKILHGLGSATTVSSKKIDN